MWTPEAWYGGAAAVDMSSMAVYYLPRRKARVWTFKPDNNADSVALPDARLLPVGTSYLIINEAGSGFTLHIVNNTISAEVTSALAFAYAAEVVLADNTTQDGIWFVKRSQL